MLNSHCARIIRIVFKDLYSLLNPKALALFHNSEIDLLVKILHRQLLAPNRLPLSQRRMIAKCFQSPIASYDSVDSEQMLQDHDAQSSMNLYRFLTETPILCQNGSKNYERYKVRFPSHDNLPSRLTAVLLRHDMCISPQVRLYASSC